MQGKARSSQDAYFRDALDWLKNKHGAENVVYAGIHRDETTPHMYAYVVPRVGEKLNCRQFLGGARALNEMQTDFAQSVGIKHGLERGLEGSRARHTAIGQYYGRVNQKTPQTPDIDLPEPSIGDRLNPRAYGEKGGRIGAGANEACLEIYGGQSRETDLARHKAKESRAAHDDQAKRMRPLVDALRPLNQKERSDLAVVMQRVSDKFVASRQAQAALAQAKQQREAQRGRDKDNDLSR